MRALALALVLSVPLVAGEENALARAVSGFASDRAPERDAASQRVQAHLKKALAPLLEAMNSSDPEVARRARRALASFLPVEKEERAEEQSGVGVGGAKIVLFGNQFKKQQALRLVVNKNGRKWRIVPAVADKQHDAIQKFGVDGEPVMSALLRKQLGLAAGRGFAIETVGADSAAAALGLEAHDVVLEVNGKPVQEWVKFAAALGAEKDWKSARLKILRGGAVKELGGG